MLVGSGLWLNSAAPANAASTATVTAVSSGSYRNDGYHDAATASYFVGEGVGFHYRDLFTFGMGGITRTIKSATMEIPNGVACGSHVTSDGPPGTLSLYDVDTPHDQLYSSRPVGDGTGLNIYADLGSGTLLGDLRLASADESPVTVPFTPYGIDVLNAARGGWLDVGGTYADQATTPQNIFQGAGYTCGVKLNLTFAKQDQTITFPNPGPLTYGDAPVTLGATASSDLTVRYAVKSGPCEFRKAVAPSKSLVLTGAGQCVVAATQDGDDDWNAAAEVDDTIVINKAPTVTALTTTPAAPKLGQPVTLAATVAPVTTPFYGPTAATGSVTFFVDGALAATVALANGGASTVAAFGGGSHTITARYSGDSNYLASDSSDATVTIVCDRTLTGSVSAVTATSGLTCINRATVNGGISIAKGAALDLERTTVKGSISANAPSGLRICGSTTGAISVSGATGSVVIGDPRGINLCAANKISSGVTVANNTAPVVVVGNKVASGVTAANNTGGQTITGNHP